MLSEEQQKIRAQATGSSEIAALVPDGEGGYVSPFFGPHGLWRRKTGQEPDNETSVMRRGTYFEAPTMQWYADDHGYLFRKCETIRHARHKHAVDTCDFRAWLPDDGGDEHCVEIKAITPATRHKWGEPGTDEVPLHYVVQAQWHMGHHVLPRCVLPVDTGFSRADYVIYRDEELFEALAEINEKFWRDYVIPGREPPADGDDATSQWLARRLPKRAELVKVSAQDDLAKMVAEYRDLTLKLEPIEDRKKHLENIIKQAVGDAEGLEIEGVGRITYKAQAGRASVSWEKVLLDLVPEQAKRDEIKKQYTERGVPYRVFRPQNIFKVAK